MSGGRKISVRLKPSCRRAGINPNVDQTQTVADAVRRDSDIVALLAAGQRARAFDMLLPRYEGKVFRLCCALLRDSTQAEDAAQDSLLRVWKALDGYDGRAALSSWIYAITRNRCLTVLVRRRAMASLSDEETEAQVAQMAAPVSAADDRAQQLRELVDLLPENQRRTLLLHYYEAHSTAEVALMLGCPEGTVKTHLFRARARLSDLLRQRGLDDPTLWLEDSP